MILIGTGLCILFWILETIIHAYIFQKGTFWQELLPLYDPNELWMRLQVCTILIIFGFYANYVIGKRRKAENELKRSEEELRLLSSQLFTIQEEERAKIAGQLHESIGQSLVAIKYGLENFLLEMKNNPGKVNVKPMNGIIVMIQDTIEEFRKIFMGLRPSTLDELGILATINWYFRKIQGTNHDISIEQDITIEEDDIPVYLRISMYRLLQEALGNIVKHSRADKVLISLKKKKDVIELVIKDNGIGFDLASVLSVEKHKRGFGLGSMKERITLAGGTFFLNSAGGRGTEVKATWPVG